MTVADPRSAMLSELSACAYRLGVVFGGEAERAEGTAGMLEYFRLFDRCFFAVRVATALELRLRRASAAAPSDALGEREDRLDCADCAEGAEGERPEDEGRDAADGDRAQDRDRERDQEREAEPASLPVLLRTLDGVAADAASLPGPEPAALPTLRELLTHVAHKAPPETAREPASARPSSLGLRARLAGSTTAVTLQPAAKPSGRLGGLTGGLAPRRATGPPRR
jgi:hypothetical protein